MGCKCSESKSLADKMKVWDRHLQGFNPDLIAAQLGFHVGCVKNIIADGDPSAVVVQEEPIVKLKKKKRKINENL